MKVTIHDVAKKVGVSIGTVSRVMNNREGVKDSTREKVEQAVVELGYVPESAARDLQKGRGLTIGIHFTAGTLHLAPFSVLFFQSVMRKASSWGIKVIDLPSRADGLPLTNVDGVLLLGAHHGDPRIDFLEKEGIPYVLIGHHLGKSWVAPDDEDGGRQVANYLAGCGHENVLFVGSHLHFQNIIDRLKGFQTEWKRHGLILPQQRILSGVNTPLEAYRLFLGYMKENPLEWEQITAIFACSDEIAAGLRAALSDEGYALPADLSLVGFDDMPELATDLTTVHQSIPDIAEISIRILKRIIEGGEPEHQIVPVQLILRKTSGINLRSS